MGGDEGWGKQGVKRVEKREREEIKEREESKRESVCE
jgi:hypothetical protein